MYVNNLMFDKYVELTFAGSKEILMFVGAWIKKSTNDQSSLLSTCSGLQKMTMLH